MQQVTRPDDNLGAAHGPRGYRDVLREAYGQRELESWIATNRHADDSLVVRKLAAMSRCVRADVSVGCRHARSSPVPSGQGSTPSSDPLLHLAIEGRTRDAHRYVNEQLDAGWTQRTMISEVIPAAHRRIGSMWQAGHLTIAQEHIATGVVDELLGALGRLIAPPTWPGTVAIICPEGERHTGPSRLASLLMRLDGWRTTLIGGAVPDHDLAAMLASGQPRFVAVSCTYPLALAGTARIAHIARSLGIPTIAGGAAFGGTPHRAERLGMDGWAADPEQASRRLRDWSDVAPQSRPPPCAASGPARHEDVWSRIVDRGIPQLLNASPPMIEHGDREQMGALRQELIDLLRAADQAAICDDTSIFTDYVDWLRGVQPPQGLPRQALPAAIEILRNLTAITDPSLQEILSTRGATR